MVIDTAELEVRRPEGERECILQIVPVTKIFKYLVYDLYEGNVRGSVVAETDEQAVDLAMIAAAERGCTMIEEIEVAEVGQPTN